MRRVFAFYLATGRTAKQILLTPNNLFIITFFFNFQCIVFERGCAQATSPAGEDAQTRALVLLWVLASGDLHKNISLLLQYIMMMGNLNRNVWYGLQKND